MPAIVSWILRQYLAAKAAGLINQKAKELFNGFGNAAAEADPNAAYYKEFQAAYNHVETVIKTPKRMKKNIGWSGTDILAIAFKRIGLDGAWRDFLGNLAVGCSLLIYGLKGNGKSSFALAFAQYLAHCLNKQVLYCAIEEGISAGLQEKVKEQQATSPNLKFWDRETYLENIGAGMFNPFDVVFIDAIQDVEGFNEKTILSMKEKYPNQLFVYLSQVNKAGSIRGSEKIPHYVTEIVKVEKGVAYIEKSRHGGSGDMQVNFGKNKTRKNKKENEKK